MRSSKSRSRSKSNRQRSLGNVVNRVFDSSGPEGKVRGTPQQIIDKYLTLARDAQLSNDRVAEQAFLQHAEHYTRMLGEAQREMAERQQHQQQNREDDRDGQQNRDQNRDEQNRPYRNREDEQSREQPREQPRDEARDNRDAPRRQQPRAEREDDSAPQPAPVQPALAAEGLPEPVADQSEESGPVETPEDVPATKRAPARARRTPAPRARRKPAESEDAPRAPETEGPVA